MKRTTTTAILLVIAASLAFAGSALAGSKTIKQTGQIVGDQATFVKLRVKVSGGDPQKISGFSAKNVLTRCDAKNGRVNKRFSYSALDPITVNSSNRFNAILTDSSIGLKITLKGTREAPRQGRQGHDQDQPVRPQEQGLQGPEAGVQDRQVAVLGGRLRGEPPRA